MMLQIGHRESHDIDIFIHDPQLLGFLNPDIQDLDEADLEWQLSRLLVTLRHLCGLWHAFERDWGIAAGAVGSGKDEIVAGSDYLE